MVSDLKFGAKRFGVLEISSLYSKLSNLVDEFPTNRNARINAKLVDANIMVLKLDNPERLREA